MAEFASIGSYYSFERSVKFKRRFVHDAETTEFLKTVIETSARRVKKLP